MYMSLCEPFQFFTASSKGRTYNTCMFRKGRYCFCVEVYSHTEELLVITFDPTYFKVPNYYFIEIVFGMCTTPVLVWENFEETPSGRCCNFLIHNSYLIFLQHELPVGQIKIVDKEYNKGPNKQANSFPVLSVL